MISYFETGCPGCSRPLRVRTAYAGLMIHCNYCGHPFVAANDVADRSAPPESASDKRSEEREAAEAAARRRIAELEDVADRLRRELETRTREAAEEALRSRRAEEQLDEAWHALRDREDSLRTSRRRGESDARLLREIGGDLADRDRLRGEVRDLAAHREALRAESGRLAERVEQVEAERDHLDLICREWRGERDRCDRERSQVQSALEAAEASRELASRGFREAERLWEAERLELLTEGGRTRASLDRAEAELLAARVEIRAVRAELHASKVQLEAEVLARIRQDRGSRSVAQGLRGEIESLRLERESIEKVVSNLDGERGRLEDSLRRSVTEAAEARRLHAIEAQEWSAALSEARGHQDEISGRLGEVQDQLRSAHIEMERAERERRLEQQEHRLVLDAIRIDRDAERRAQDDRIAAERSRHDEETSRHLGEVEALRVQADGLRGEVFALRAEAQVDHPEIERMREEAERLSAGHAGLLRELEEMRRDRDEQRSRHPGSEGGPWPANGEPPSSSVAQETAWGRSEETRTDDLNGPQQVPVDLPDRMRSVEIEHSPGWPLPQVADLEEARGQIALLTDLLLTAQQANAGLSARLAKLMGSRPAGADSTSARPAGMTTSDEVSFHLEVQRRTARLAQRRRSGRA